VWYQNILDRDLVPDAIIRWGIRRLCARQLREQRRSAHRSTFLRELRASPIALHPHRPNEQHYDVPPEFYAQVLGPRLKYSCGLWSEGVTDLAAAEERMLALTCARAGVRDGHQILDLGCGWGSFALYAAERFPNASVLAVSNSASQGSFIREEAKKRGLTNLQVETADVNDFQPPSRFDRVVSVEMFEHLKNYGEMLARIAGWLRPGGRLFVHMFVHREFAYHYQSEGPHDWMGRHFFTGGTMPAHDLLQDFEDDLVVMEGWRVPGGHYRDTCEAWLRNMDAHRSEILPILAATYGPDQAKKWWVRWRVFFLACSELFGFAGGKEWFVGHYLLGHPS
jgi:cyclopropane-fatty-acyl-phospholipid synthase